MSFEKWIEEQMPNQNAWDRCQNLKNNSGASMPIIREAALEVLENESYPKEDMMDMVEAQVNYTLLNKMQ